MKSLKDLTKRFQSPPAPAHPEYSESDTLIVKKLFESMKANYGALFLATLDDPETQRLWERSWMASITGKDPERVAQALTSCLDTHPRPFTRADFQTAYRSLIPRAAHQRNAAALALPSSTWQERREIAQKHITEARELLK